MPKTSKFSKPLDNQIYFRVSPVLHKTLKIKAAEKDVTMLNLVRASVTNTILNIGGSVDTLDLEIYNKYKDKLQLQLNINGESENDK